MNDVLKAIRERRSCRAFKPDLPPQEVIDQIIEAGLYAPSGMGSQSPIIIALTNRELRDRLSVMNREVVGFKEGDPFYGSPVVLIVLADRNVPTHVYDGSVAMENMLLAAHSLGLGGIWIHRAKEVFDSPEGREMLQKFGVEGDYEGIGHCIIGYPVSNDTPDAAERKAGRVYYVE